MIQHDMQMLSHKCSGFKVTNAVFCFQNESRPKCEYIQLLFENVPFDNLIFSCSFYNKFCSKLYAQNLSRYNFL